MYSKSFHPSSHPSIHPCIALHYIALRSTRLRCVALHFIHPESLGRSLPAFGIVRRWIRSFHPLLLPKQTTVLHPVVAAMDLQAVKRQQGRGEKHMENDMEQTTDEKSPNNHYRNHNKSFIYNKTKQQIT